MVRKHKLGLVIGGFLALWHAVWAIMVATGIAQGFYDFVLKIHMLSIPIAVLPFNLGYAVGLVFVTAIFGYLFGWVIAWLWNWANRR